MVKKGANVNHPDKHQLAPIHKFVILLLLLTKKINYSFYYLEQQLMIDLNV